MSYKAKAEKYAKELGVTIERHHGCTQIVYQGDVIYSFGIKNGYEIAYHKLIYIKVQLKKNNRFLERLTKKMDQPYLKEHKNPSVQLLIDNSKNLGLCITQNRAYFDFYKNDTLIRRVKGARKAQLFIHDYRKLKNNQEYGE